MTKKKFLVFISDSISGGGAELSFRKIITPYLEQPCDSRICVIILDWTSSPFCESLARKTNLWFIHKGFRLHTYLKILPVIWSLLIPIISLYNKLDGYSPAIISFQTRSNLIACLARLFSFFTLPILISERIHIDSYLAFHPFRKFYSIAIRFLYVYANRIVCNSKDSSLALSRFLKQPLSRISTVLNGYNFDLIRSYSQRQPEHTFSTSNVPIFVTVARLEEQKCHELILKALSIYRKKYSSSFVWIIIGDGKLMNSLRDLTNLLHMNDHVVFLGHVNNPLPYVRICNIFLFASLAEGFPNSLAEAVILNKPIVTNKFKAGLQDVLESYQQHLICSSNRPEAYADTIYTLVKRTSDHALHSTYVPSYTYEKMLVQFTELIDELHDFR